MGAIFGGKMPSSHTYIPGGFTATVDNQSIDRFMDQLTWLIDFIRNIYLPDVQAVAGAYPDYFQIGGGYGHLMSYGVFETSDDGREKLFMPGYARNASLSPHNLPLQYIKEHVGYSWYEDEGTLNPSFGATTAQYPKGDAYSWLKSPRYLDQPTEVGPLARMWIRGHYQNGVSVMDRHAARAEECLLVAEAMMTWLNELQSGEPVYQAFSVRDNSGVGLTEAPRGALGHWIQVQGGRISHYQIITPTCWNASPRDNNGLPGPMEQALIGTPIENPDEPVEALRVIHSFDPCLSCAVHVMRPGGPVSVLPSGPAK